jgi:hypothetical protein
MSSVGPRGLPEIKKSERRCVPFKCVRLKDNVVSSFLFDRERSERALSYHLSCEHAELSGVDTLPGSESRKAKTKGDVAAVPPIAIRHSVGMEGRMDYGCQFNLGETDAGIGLWASRIYGFFACGLQGV